LLEVAATAFVVDMGSGAFANLLRYRTPESLDAVLITHMHADHFLDLIPLRYALKYGERTHAKKLPLYLPPDGETMLRGLCSVFASEVGDDFLGDAFEIHTYDPSVGLALGNVAVRFARTKHFIPTYALRCEAAGTSFAFSSDSSPSPTVVELAREADLFLCEATLGESAPGAVSHGHSSAREAATMATDAGAKRLALTHYPASAMVDDVARIASSVFAGPVEVVDDGTRLVIG
jgi:ribonuclease BN (tRNA processing enzyme)